MSELTFFSFEAQESDIAAWEKVFSTLEAGQRGVKFQQAMEVFGEAVSDALEAFLESEEYGPESFVFESWQREGLEFFVEFDMPYESIDTFTEIFSLCPISNLTVDVAE